MCDDPLGFESEGWTGIMLQHFIHRYRLLRAVAPAFAPVPHLGLCPGCQGYHLGATVSRGDALLYREQLPFLTAGDLRVPWGEMERNSQ